MPAYVDQSLDQMDADLYYLSEENHKLKKALNKALELVNDIQDKVNRVAYKTEYAYGDIVSDKEWDKLLDILYLR